MSQVFLQRLQTDIMTSTIKAIMAAIYASITEGIIRVK